MKGMKGVVSFFHLFLCALFLASGAEEVLNFPEEIQYDPFYAAILTDGEKEVYTLLNVSYLSPEGEQKFFVWFRRGTDRGIMEYPVSLSKIRRLELTGSYEVFPDGYTPCRITLSSGESYEGFLDTSGYFQGLDEAFGCYARIYLQYNGILTMDFLSDGRYSICPLCKALYYDRYLESCPFDGTKLLPQISP